MIYQSLERNRLYYNYFLEISEVNNYILRPSPLEIP
jgi:hypothetical protein